MPKTDRKKEYIETASTAVLKRIINSLQGPELEGPLAGIIQVENIGQIKVADIQAELSRRGEL